MQSITVLRAGWLTVTVGVLATAMFQAGASVGCGAANTPAQHIVIAPASSAESVPAARTLPATESRAAPSTSAPSAESASTIPSQAEQQSSDAGAIDDCEPSYFPATKSGILRSRPCSAPQRSAPKQQPEAQ